VIKVADLYSLLKQFNTIGGMEETGQSGFCLLMALWQKSNELQWRNKFNMTNTELLYRAGFGSEKTLIRVRNRLTELGYIKYISPDSRRKCGTYILEFDLMGLLDRPEESIEGNIKIGNEDNSVAECLPEESKDDSSGHNCLPGESSEVSSQGNRDVSSEGNINKLNKTKQNEDEDLHNPYIFYSKNIGPMLPDISDLISQYQKDLPDELIVEAFKIAVRNNARSIRYAEKIMISWLDKGIRTMDALRIHEAQRENKRARDGNENEPKKPKKRVYTSAEINAAADYIREAIRYYKGSDVLSYIRSLGYPQELTKSAINLLVKRKELVL
jgi:DnaD/phage-associated family protein